MWAIINFFEDGSDDFETDTNRMLWAQWHSVDHRFIYKDSGDDTVVSETFMTNILLLIYCQGPSGIFRSSHLLSTLAVHFNRFAPRDGDWIPGLKFDAPDHEPWGAIALAATAVSFPC